MSDEQSQQLSDMLEDLLDDIRTREAASVSTGSIGWPPYQAPTSPYVDPWDWGKHNQSTPGKVYSYEDLKHSYNTVKIGSLELDEETLKLMFEVLDFIQSDPEIGQAFKTHRAMRRLESDE